MEFRYLPPAYSPSNGLPLEWDNGCCVTVKITGGEVVIAANRAGLLSLAKQMITLAAENVPAGTHVHYDAGDALEDNSTGLIVTRLEDSRIK